MAMEAFSKAPLCSMGMHMTSDISITKKDIFKNTKKSQYDSN